MGEIQDYINEHLTINHSFVKSIQVTDKSDDDVIIPRGYNMRFINCKIKKLTARESAIHFIGGNADDLRLAFCLVSMDGVTVEKDIKATNCRICLLYTSPSPRD